MIFEWTFHLYSDDDDSESTSPTLSAIVFFYFNSYVFVTLFKTMPTSSNKIGQSHTHEIFKKDFFRCSAEEDDETEIRK